MPAALSSSCRTRPPADGTEPETAGPSSSGWVAARSTLDAMNPQPATRITLLAVEAFVAVTAFAGGLALMLGAIIPYLSFVIIPPADYLEGSPFSSYLVPGLLLALVLGGVNA